MLLTRSTVVESVAMRLVASVTCVCASATDPSDAVAWLAIDQAGEFARGRCDRLHVVIG